MKYRKEIDGLRAFAVLPVVLFHGSFDFFSGGFVGVDIFFVISGYLITTIILAEKEEGVFTITGFYERRARRILPALLFVMLACVPFAWLWMTPSELEDFSQSLIAVSLFSSNILFWSETGYFATAAELKPLLHTWSLAVEEQYYLIFPVVILLLWRYGKKVVVALLVMVTISSLLLAQWGSMNYPSATFYLLPTRVWELLIGSIVAFYLFGKLKNHAEFLRPTLLTQALGSFGLILILYSIFVFDSVTPFPGFYGLVPTVGTALIILFGSNKTYVGQFLGSRVFVGIGLISYSAYLWHQPLFAYARLRSLHGLDEITAALLAIFSLILAYFTWRFVEKPFRNRAKIPRSTIFKYSLASCICIVFIGVLGTANGGFDSRSTPGGKRFDEINIKHRLDSTSGLSGICDSEFKTAADCRTDSRPEMLVWGDSNAMHLISGLLASHPEAKIVQMTKTSCGPIIGLAPISKDKPIGWAKGCLEFNSKVAEWAAASTTLKFAVLSSQFSQYFSKGSELLLGGVLTDVDALVVYESFVNTLDFLSEHGIKPVVFAPPPSVATDIGRCLSTADIFGYDPGSCDFERQKSELYQLDILKLLRKVDVAYRVIWMSDIMCTASTCNSNLEKVRLYKDAKHLSRAGSAYVGKKMDFYKLITAE